MLTLFLPALVAACIFVTGLYLQEWFERPCRILKPKRPPTPVISIETGRRLGKMHKRA